MKALIKMILIAIMFSSCVLVNTTKMKAQEVSMQVFYDQLSPYGDWVTYKDYGYVWVPTTAGPDFFPYGTQGYWDYADCGWTWVSMYPWGWAPFHYGSWVFDPYYGWIWVPDVVWGPAWVCWGGAPGYYGWFPMEPGFDIYYYHRHWRHYNHERWTFVHSEHMGRHDIYDHYGPRNENNHLIRKASVITNTYRDNNRNQVYASGPNVNEVQKATGNNISPARINDVGAPGQTTEANNQVTIYRPNVVKTTINNNVAMPAKINRIEDVTPLNQRKAIDQKSITPYQGPENNRQPEQRPNENQVQPRKEQPNQPIERGREERPAPNVQPREPREAPRPSPQMQPRQQPWHPPMQQQPRPVPAPMPRYTPSPQPRPMPRPRADTPVKDSTVADLKK